MKEKNNKIKTKEYAVEHKLHVQNKSEVEKKKWHRNRKRKKEKNKQIEVKNESITTQKNTMEIIAVKVSVYAFV